MTESPKRSIRTGPVRAHLSSARSADAPNVL
jgi:hypothetical protein